MHIWVFVSDLQGSMGTFFLPAQKVMNTQTEGWLIGKCSEVNMKHNKIGFKIVLRDKNCGEKYLTFFFTLNFDTSQCQF